MSQEAPRLRQLRNWIFTWPHKVLSKVYWGSHDFSRVLHALRGPRWVVVAIAMLCRDVLRKGSTCARVSLRRRTSQSEAKNRRKNCTRQTHYISGSRHLYRLSLYCSGAVHVTVSVSMALLVSVSNVRPQQYFRTYRDHS